MLKKIILSSLLARAMASCDHGIHCTGLWACCSRYGDEACMRSFVCAAVAAIVEEVRAKIVPVWVPLVCVLAILVLALLRLEKFTELGLESNGTDRGRKKRRAALCMATDPVRARRNELIWVEGAVLGNFSCCLSNQPAWQRQCSPRQVSFQG